MHGYFGDAASSDVVVRPVLDSLTILVAGAARGVGLDLARSQGEL